MCFHLLWLPSVVHSSCIIIERLRMQLMYISLSVIAIAAQLNSYACQTAVVLIGELLSRYEIPVEEDDDDY